MAKSNYQFYVYLMASSSRVVYIGVTNDLILRTEEHKAGVNQGFTKQYKVDKLVYYEYFTDVAQAIKREKEIKRWRREKKLQLIQSQNPRWEDLYKMIAQ